MQNIVTILIPIFLLILLGYTFRRIGFPSLRFWPMLERLTYYVLFPALLIFKLSTANLDEVNNFDVVLVASISMIFVLLITLILNLIKRSENSAFTSVVQGAIRFNAYIFLSIVESLLGDMGLVVAAILMAFMVPLVNFLCISVFSYFVSTNGLDIKSFIKSVFSNPLIVACIVGGVLNLSGLNVPIIFTNTLGILGAAALPLGLLSVGVGLEFGSINSARYELFISSFLKLLIFPLVIFFVANYFGITKEALIVLIIFASIPTATSSYILARQLGGDTKLMASILTFQTLVGMVTISIIVGFFNV